MQTRNYKFRLYPNSDQQNKLQNNLAVCRWIYNKMVEKIHKEGFQSRNDLSYFLTELKESEKWLYSYHSKMLQMICTQAYGAQKTLIELRKKGHKTGDLRFVRYDKFLTLTYNQSGFDITKHADTDLLFLSKIGFVEIRKHRHIPDNAKIKQVLISKSKLGRWYACVTVDIDMAIPKISLTKSVGIDVGIKNFVYDSDGFVTPNPLNLQKMLTPLRRVQRKMARRQKDSKNRKKAVRFYQIIHERIRNRRNDFLHKISTRYARRYDMVFVERLQKLNMIKNHMFARNILDSGWGTFTNMLDYKTMLIDVPGKNTTVDCSRYGNMVPKSLAVRTHKCDMCGLILDRDHNASINILKKGLHVFNIKLPQELREFTPVENTQCSMKQENATRLGL